MIQGSRPLLTTQATPTSSTPSSVSPTSVPSPDCVSESDTRSLSNPHGPPRNPYRRTYHLSLLERKGRCGSGRVVCGTLLRDFWGSCGLVCLLLWLRSPRL